ncbi:protein SPMIP3 [Carettochelys insculpta]|uniref:protein SPMIP3 n=1 Tax=Carettochelys insculpta TaxID=44489 RepID=UPI003EB6CC58
MSCTAIRLRQFVDPTPYLPPGTVIRQGKDIQGFYPGQLGRVHKAYLPETAPGPFIKLYPTPVKHEVEIQCQHDFDNLTLKNYVHFQRTKKMTTNEWPKQSTYKEEFALPFYHVDCDEHKYTPRTDPGPLTIWRNIADPKNKLPLTAGEGSISTEL